MQIPTRLLVLPLLLAYPMRTSLSAQAAPDNAQTNLTTTVRWNRLVPGLVDETMARRRAARTAATAAGDSATLRRIAQTPPPFLFRVYTLLSVAQYAAVNSAKDNRAVSSDAAVASASAAVLATQFPDSAVRASIARELSLDLDRARAESRKAELATAGQRLGEDVASRTMASAPPLVSLMGPWTGTVPKGPGMWYSAPGIPPIGVLMAKARPWLLDSASQFRPAPPPTYGSPTWTAALEEVRRVARRRTPEQTRIAQSWNSADPWARWNQTAADALRRHHASDAQAARVFAV